jgi:hypothetical protein
MDCRQGDGMDLPRISLHTIGMCGTLRHSLSATQVCQLSSIRSFLLRRFCFLSLYCCRFRLRAWESLVKPGDLAVELGEALFEDGGRGGLTPACQR